MIYRKAVELLTELFNPDSEGSENLDPSNETEIHNFQVEEPTITAKLDSMCQLEQTNQKQTL